MSNDEVIVARNIYKTYFVDRNPVAVLKGIDFSLTRGEMVFIFGASGVGKSTFLHLIGALDVPTSGEVVIGDISVFRLNSFERSRVRNRKIGFVFQFYHLLQELSAVENVYLPAMIMRKYNKRNGAEIKERAISLLEQVGLGARIHHSPSQLSGGELQRVALARAMINDPDIILADEPTGNLDTKTSEGIHELLSSLNREQQMTLVIVTHDREFARRGNRTIYMVDGRFEQ